MKTQLLAIARRNHLDQLADAIDRIDGELRLSIGFIGEFSSGKSSLINAVLGERLLPAMDKPTTASITEVEPCRGLDRVQFLRRTGTEVEEVGPLDFSEIATGRASGTALLRVPARLPLLRDGFRFVDTPGTSSLEESHRDVTFGYLSQLDGAVVCVDINQGGVTASLATLLQRSDVRVFADRLLIALCRADQKTSAACKQVRDDVVAKVSELLGGRVDRTVLEDRVVTVSSRHALEGQGGLEGFITSFARTFIEPSSELLNARTHRSLREHGMELLQALRTIRDDLGLDGQALIDRETQIDEQLKELDAFRSEAEQKLAEFGRRLRKSLLRTATSHEASISGAAEDELEGRCDALMQAMTAAACEELERFEESLATPTLDHLSDGLRQQIARITHYVDVGKTLLTAAAIAALTQGGSLVIHAGEGAAAKELAKRAANEEAHKDGLLGQLAKLFERLNPINHAGDLLADYLKRRAAETGLMNLADSVAETVEARLSGWYLDERIAPLERQQRDRRASLRAIREERRAATVEIERARRLLEQDIVNVSALAAG